MTTVYRVAAAEAPVTGRASTLAYHPLRRGHGSSAMGFFTLMSPAFVAAAVALVGLPELALPAMVAAGVALFVVRRRARKRPAATLNVEGETLRAFGPSGAEILSTPLVDLLDITLETKTIEVVQEAPGPVPELMYVNSTVGLALDTSRIMLVTRRDGVIPLTEELMPHSDSLEWRGKMRRFLRNHDWKPEEMPPPPGPKKKRRITVDDDRSSHRITVKRDESV